MIGVGVIAAPLAEKRARPSPAKEGRALFTGDIQKGFAGRR
jgi:hypothetical protein